MPRKSSSEAIPVCSACLSRVHMGGEPDFPWRKARRGEACGAADHDDVEIEILAGKADYMSRHEAGTARENPDWTPRQQMQRAAAEEEAAKWQEKFAERWSSPEGRKHRRQAALDAARSYKGQQPISFIWATFARNGWTPEETDAFLEEVGTTRENPAGAVRTKEDERLWSKAKAQAAKQGRGGDWGYVMGIFKKMRGGARKNPAKRIKHRIPAPAKRPFVCPACGGKGPGGAASVTHKSSCVFLKRKNPTPAAFSINDFDFVKLERLAKRLGEAMRDGGTPDEQLREFYFKLNDLGILGRDHSGGANWAVGAWVIGKNLWFVDNEDGSFDVVHRVADEDEGSFVDTPVAPTQMRVDDGTLAQWLRDLANQVAQGDLFPRQNPHYPYDDDKPRPTQADIDNMWGMTNEDVPDPDASDLRFTLEMMGFDTRGLTDDILWDMIKGKWDFHGKKKKIDVEARKGSRRKNPAPAPGTPSPTMRDVMACAKRLGVSNRLSAAFTTGFTKEWSEHGGGLDLDAIGQLVVDHLAEDPRYYSRRR